jgi:hypothetical protein
MADSQVPGVTVVPQAQLVPPPGVVVAPPETVHFDIHDQVMKSLRRDVEPGHTMAMVSIQTDRGVNLAIAHKEKLANGFFAGDWVVEGWIGKSGWDQPLKQGWASGVQVMWSK